MASEADQGRTMGPIPMERCNYFYNECGIDSTLASGVIVVDRQGTVVQIPGNATGRCYSNDHLGRLVVYKRESTEPRYDPKSKVLSERPIPATIRTLTHSDLASPMYIPELDVVVGLAQDAPRIRHPGADVQFKDALEGAVNVLLSKKTPSLRIFVNDPTKQLTSLWVHWGGEMFEVRATAFPHQVPSILIVLATPGHGFKTYEFPLSDSLKTKADVMEIENTLTLWVAGSRYILHDAIEQLKRGGDPTINPGDVAYVEGLKQKHRDTLDLIKAQYETKLKQAAELRASDVSDHALEVIKLKQEITVLKSQIDRWEGMSTTQNAIIKTIETVKVSDEKVKTAQHATETKRLEHASVIWKVVGGAVIAVATFLITRALTPSKE